MVCLLQGNQFISSAFIFRINHFVSPRELKKLNLRAHYRKTLISLGVTSSYYKSFSHKSQQELISRCFALTVIGSNHVVLKRCSK